MASIFVPGKIMLRLKTGADLLQVTKLKEWLASFGVSIEPEEDGYRVLLIVKRGSEARWIADLQVQSVVESVDLCWDKLPSPTR